MEYLAIRCGWVVENYLNGEFNGYEIEDSLDSVWTLTVDPFCAKLYHSKEYAMQSDLFVNQTNAEECKVKYMRLTCEIDQGLESK